MFLTTHAAAGILISQYTSTPLTVFGYSFASHFLLDFIPHGDEHLYHDQEWKVFKKYRRVLVINAIDVGTLVILMFWAINQPAFADKSLVLLAIIGSIIPDFLSHFFPVIHERFSWLFLIRWFYSFTKPTGLRYLVRLQNWFHRVLHHEVIPKDIPVSAGIAMQLVLTTVCIVLSVG